MAQPGVTASPRRNIYDFFTGFNQEKRKLLAEYFAAHDINIAIPIRPDIFPHILDSLKNSQHVSVFLNFFDPFDPELLEVEDIEKKIRSQEMFYSVFKRFITLLQTEQAAELFRQLKEIERAERLWQDEKAAASAKRFQELNEEVMQVMAQTQVEDVEQPVLEYINNSKQTLDKLDEQIAVLQEYKQAKVKQHVEKLQVKMILPDKEGEKALEGALTTLVDQLKDVKNKKKDELEKEIGRIKLEAEGVKKYATEARAKIALEAAGAAFSRVKKKKRKEKESKESPYSPITLFKKVFRSQEDEEREAQNERERLERADKHQAQYFMAVNNLELSEKAREEEAMKAALEGMQVNKLMFDKNIRMHRLDQVPFDEKVHNTEQKTPKYVNAQRFRQEVVNACHSIEAETRYLAEQQKALEEQRAEICNGLIKVTDAALERSPKDERLQQARSKFVARGGVPSRTTPEERPLNRL